MASELGAVVVAVVVVVEEHCARHLTSSVGAETTKVARPAIAPAVQILDPVRRIEDGDEEEGDGESGFWPMSVMQRLKVTKRIAFRKP